MARLVLVVGFLTLCLSAAALAADDPASNRQVASASSAAVITPTELTALSRFKAQFPGAMFYREGSRLTRVYGRTFEMGDTPQQSAERFLSENADLLAVQAADLVPVTKVLPSGNTLPLMYDEESGTYGLTLIYYSQYRDGVPVFRSDLRLLVRNEPGYPLVWAGSSLRRLGDFHPDFNQPMVADPAQSADGMTPYTSIDLVIWAGVNDQEVDPVLAWTFQAGDDASNPPASMKKWQYVVDAATGEVLYKENLIVFTDVTGSVRGMATTIPKSDACNPESSTVMKYAKVAIGATTAYATGTGSFTIPNGGSAPVTVTSYMDGQYFLMNTAVGSVETLTMNVTPPGPANFVHNEANTSEYIRAQVNAYVQANVVRDWVLTQNPSYPTISTQTNFPLYVNRSDYYCPGNAWYDPSAQSMSFCTSSGSYPNTAYSNVIHHEYGHHLCAMGGTGQDQYGEGVGDSVAVCLADDPILGYGFTGNCNTGIRTADNTMQYPCSSDIHTCAQLLSGCVWSTRNQLFGTNPRNYLAILSKLMLNSIPMHAPSGAINPAIYTDWITLDNNFYAGAHVAQITAGFEAHNMVPAPPPPNDACANAIAACPGSNYTGNTGGATVDGSATCGTSSSTPDVWYVYTPATSGSATFSLCGSGTTYDSVISVRTGACPGASQLGCDDDGCGSSGGPSTVTAAVTGGVPYLIRVSGYSGHTGAYSLSITGPACVPADSAPPTPNPMSFSSSPAAASSTSITMTASEATDAASPPVSYYFDFVSGGTGGDDSGWQAGRIYTDTGLSPNTAYTYRVKARDSAASPNETDYSGEVTATTWAEVPPAPALSGATRTTLDISVDTGTNPAGTELAVQCTATAPTDAAWMGQYVSATGTPSSSAVWRTAAAWGTATIGGLQGCTAYTFAVKARNGDLVETALGSGASLDTTGRLGDLNGDDLVDADDIQQYVGCAVGAGAGCGCSGLDLSAFVSCLLDAGACP